jgi:hypothetical protein
MVTGLDSAVAVYWDFENVHACLLDDLQGDGSYRSTRFRPQEPLVDIDPVAGYAATFGRVVIHRAYCNWQYYSRYRDELQAHAVDLVQLFPLTGSKNGADIRLVLDVAEDLQRHSHLSHVVVVASDSDYTSLAQRCRRQGRFYIGVGTSRTAPSYKYACDEFRLYRDLAAAGASPAAAETNAADQDLATLEDAADLVVKAVRMLAAGRGESWALKAAVRPLVKRLDPAFDERNFGFTTFAGLLQALDDRIVERTGEYDHELAVRADTDGQASLGGVTAVSSTPAIVVERQLRRRGLRLPDERRVLWAVPELIVDAFGGPTTIEPSFDSLRLKIEPRASALGFPLSEVDFNKVKGILWRGRVFDLHGHGNGISLRVCDLGGLRKLLLTVLLEHLASPADEDPAVLAEAFFGPDATEEQIELVTQTQQTLVQERSQAEKTGAETPPVP